MKLNFVRLQKLTFVYISLKRVCEKKNTFFLHAASDEYQFFNYNQLAFSFFPSIEAAFSFSLSLPSFRVDKRQVTILLSVVVRRATDRTSDYKRRQNWLLIVLGRFSRDRKAAGWRTNEPASQRLMKLSSRTVKKTDAESRKSDDDSKLV